MPSFFLASPVCNCTILDQYCHPFFVFTKVSDSPVKCQLHYTVRLWFIPYYLAFVYKRIHYSFLSLLDSHFTPDVTVLLVINGLSPSFYSRTYWKILNRTVSAVGGTAWIFRANSLQSTWLLLIVKSWHHYLCLKACISFPIYSDI